jgi:UDP-N-acetyl-D-galactosamine dehydrogenase
MLGITFKENCPDVRNKNCDVIAALTDYGISVTIYDPLPVRCRVKEYKLITTNTVPNQKFDALVLAVGHKEFFKFRLGAIAS